MAKKLKMAGRLSAMLLALALLLTAAACKGAETTPGAGGSGDEGASGGVSPGADIAETPGDPIKIGTSFPLTGTVAADGQYIVQAIQFAV
ncbi:MAG: hypothetical protein LBD49_02330, partial [Oscillospiraceae bacterium]|nr:hypothetical protein [Oscillospiraceae bacterium]